MNEDKEAMSDEIPPPVPGIEQLRSDALPARELWSGIQARIAPPRRRFAPAYWRAAAAAGFAVLVIGIGLVAQRPHAPVAARAPLVAPPDFVALTRPSAGNPALLSAALRTPETRALVRVNLKIVNDARSQIERALDSDPHNASLQNLLLTTRQQQSELRRALADPAPVAQP